ncbi:type II restriction endonuclease TdeIII [Laceyella sediminis]|uniref:type II site-specific deoxyribonuclease n=1 Tax=Laceyella sediminis TaxID=573074 RepID=A0ABX5ERF6_9BACL|nr:TdeIII family type II restriction endonuclease [Laceyella sediminis]PRZ16318.1 type II restriction endonuclease TdeIII [Laceyella sediminis]
MKFGYRLAPIEVWKGSTFERSFSSSLGSAVFEQIGRIIAEGSGAYAKNQYKTELTINSWRIDEIERLVNNPKRTQGRRKEFPDLQAELDKIISLDIDKYQQVKVISDLYVRRPDGHEEYYSFKTVKPNKDQTKEAKRNLLYLRSTDPNCEAFFALPYNPSGEGKPYRKSWTVPDPWFDMEDDRFVLIGSKLWNKLGNDPNTYEELLDVFAEAGKITSARIRKEYFCL